MTISAKRALFWSPRILCVLFALFISIFALDVFGEGQTLGQTMVALLMHLIPTFVIIAVLALSWRWAWIGGVVFLGLAILYILAAWGRFHWSAYAAISGPLCVVGALFVANWVLREEIRARPEYTQG